MDGSNVEKARGGRVTGCSMGSQELSGQGSNSRTVGLLASIIHVLFYLQRKMENVLCFFLQLSPSLSLSLSLSRSCICFCPFISSTRSNYSLWHERVRLKAGIICWEITRYFGSVGFSFYRLYSFLWRLLLFFFTLFCTSLTYIKAMSFQNGLACKLRGWLVE